MGLTSHNQLGNTGRKMGFWLEEFCGTLLRFQKVLTFAFCLKTQIPIKSARSRYQSRRARKEQSDDSIGYYLLYRSCVSDSIRFLLRSSWRCPGGSEHHEHWPIYL